jgi:hypothetical protein
MCECNHGFFLSSAIPVSASQTLLVLKSDNGATSFFMWAAGGEEGTEEIKLDKGGLFVAL